jgi:hypothetical protein
MWARGGSESLLSEAMLAEGLGADEGFGEKGEMTEMTESWSARLAWRA